MRKLFRSRLLMACVIAVATTGIAVGGISVAANGGGKKSLSKAQKKQVNALIAKYVKRHPGPAGPAGAAGQPGPAGPAGRDGVVSTTEAAGQWAWADMPNNPSVAVCPSGTVPTGGGVNADYWNETTQETLPNDGRIVITYSVSNDSNGDDRPDGWTAAARQAPGTSPPAGYRAEVVAIANCSPGTAASRAGQVTSVESAELRTERAGASTFSGR